MLVGLVVVPAYMAYFEDNAILGVWYTLIAALNWILTFDFGIGNGLRHNFAIAMGNNDEFLAKKYVSTAYIGLGSLTLLLCVFGIVAISQIDPYSFFFITNETLPKEAFRLSVILVFAGTMMHFWLKLLTSILYALQKTALNNALFLVGNVLILVFLLAFQPYSLEERFLSMAIVQVIAINGPLVICTIVLFFGKYRRIAPSISCWDFSVVKDIVGLGTLFFVIQIALLFVNASNEILISVLYGASDVVSFQAYYKVFFTIVTMFTLVVQPIWSGMTVAFVEQRYAWIRKVSWLFTIICIGGSAVACILAALFPWISAVWLGDGAIDVSIENGLAFAAWVSVMLFANSSTCLANASGRLRVQLVFTLVAAVLKIALSAAFAIAGCPWIFVMVANAIALVPLVVAQSAANITLLNKLERTTICRREAA